jgi:hypothetical protein
MDRTENFIEVICISEREYTDKESFIKMGKRYYIDPMSLFIDSDGDSFATVYDITDTTNLGKYMLKHFMSA